MNLRNRIKNLWRLSGGETVVVIEKTPAVGITTTPPRMAEIIRKKVDIIDQINGN